MKRGKRAQVGIGHLFAASQGRFKENELEKL
jgi:hypothetical protein